MADDYEVEDMTVDHDPYIGRLKTLYDDACRWAAMIRNQPSNQVARDNFAKVMNQSQAGTEEETTIYQIVRNMYHTSNHGYMGIVGANNGGKYIFFTDSLKILQHFGVSDYIFMTFDSGESNYIVRPRDDRGQNFNSSDYGHRNERDQQRRGGYPERGRGRGRGGHSDRGGQRGGHSDRGHSDRGHSELGRDSDHSEGHRGGYGGRGRGRGYGGEDRGWSDRGPRRNENVQDISKLVRETIQKELAGFTEEARKAQRKAKYVPKSIRRAEEAEEAAHAAEPTNVPAAAKPEPKSEPVPEVTPAKPAAVAKAASEKKKPAAVIPAEASEPKQEPKSEPKPEPVVAPAAAPAPKAAPEKKKSAKGSAKKAATEVKDIMKLDAKPAAPTKTPIPMSKSWADDVEEGGEMTYD